MDRRRRFPATQIDAGGQIADALDRGQEVQHQAILLARMEPETSAHGLDERRLRYDPAHQSDAGDGRRVEALAEQERIRKHLDAMPSSEIPDQRRALADRRLVRNALSIDAGGTK